MIIAIEGIDASGKATQSKIIAERAKGVVVAFPTYSTPAGQAILGNVRDEWSAMVRLGDLPWVDGKVNALVLQALMTINRFEMLPAIQALRDAGTPVIFDRYYASAVVYGVDDGLDRSWIELIQAQLPEPDAFIYLDVDPEESVRRRPERRDRYEKEPGKMERVRRGYLNLWLEHQGDKRWQVVDGDAPIDVVTQRIMWALAGAGIVL